LALNPRILAFFGSCPFLSSLFLSSPTARELRFCRCPFSRGCPPVSECVFFFFPNFFWLPPNDLLPIFFFVFILWLWYVALLVLFASFYPPFIAALILGCEFPPSFSFFLTTPPAPLNPLLCFFLLSSSTFSSLPCFDPSVPLSSPCRIPSPRLPPPQVVRACERGAGWGPFSPLGF